MRGLPTGSAADRYSGRLRRTTKVIVPGQQNEFLFRKVQSGSQMNRVISPEAEGGDMLSRRSH